MKSLKTKKLKNITKPNPEWLDNSRTLYASKDTEWQWTEYQYNSDTHTAKLVCIEEIKKECVMHEPAEITVDVEPYTDLITFNYSANSKCKHCGVELVADWKVK